MNAKRQPFATPDPAQRKIGAFTLVELLVVITIVSVLIATLLPALGKSREHVRDLLCIKNLHEMTVATAAYATDNKGWIPHGQDMSVWWSGLGPAAPKLTVPYHTTIFDDDWLNSKPGTPNRNVGDGSQNICHVGQLMWDHYLPERGDAWACPQSDFREVSLYDYSPPTSYVTIVENMKGYWAWQAWRDDFYDGTDSYYYIGTNYDIRGPVIRDVDVIQISKYALFADHEQVGQPIKPTMDSLGVGSSPLPYWGRTHRAGFMTGYLDGSSALVRDEDRSMVYWAAQAWAYGSGEALQFGYFDRP